MKTTLEAILRAQEESGERILGRLDRLLLESREMMARLRRSRGPADTTKKEGVRHEDHVRE
jgi:hypothetical protein